MSKSDCQAALESVFGESSRGRIRVNMDGVEYLDDEVSSIFGTEGKSSSMSQKLSVFSYVRQAVLIMTASWLLSCPEEQLLSSS